MLFGCFGCVDNDSLGMTNSIFQISVVFGLVVTGAVQILGCVSGGHFNPAVTIAALVYKLITPVMGAIYVVAQLLGAFIGYGILKVLTPETIQQGETGFCVTHVNSSINSIQGVLIELFATSALVWIVCGIWHPRNAKTGHDSVPLKVGFVITALCGAVVSYH